MDLVFQQILLAPTGASHLQLVDACDESVIILAQQEFAVGLDSISNWKKDRRYQILWEG